MSRTTWMRFPLDAVDQQRVVTNSLVVNETAWTQSPAPGAAYPQSLDLKFNVNDPAQGPPRLRLTFQGLVRFIPDDPVRVPAVADIDFPAETNAANLAIVRNKLEQWDLTGAMVLTPSNRDKDRVGQSSAGLLIVPTALHFSKVRISAEFLVKLLKTRAPSLGKLLNLPKLPKTNPTWFAHAVHYFLSGRLPVPVNWGGNNDGTDDDAARPASGNDLDVMPFLDMVNDTMRPDYGRVHLVISAWNHAHPRDGHAATEKDPLGDFYPPNTAVPNIHSPNHRANGMMPAAAVLQQFSLNATLMDDAGVVADKVVRSLGGYRMLRLTRIATNNTHYLKEYSTYMTHQVLRLEDTSGTLLGRVPLPAHGIAFVPQTVLGQVQQAQAALEGGAKWLLFDTGVASDPPAWRRMGDTQPVSVDWRVEICPRLIVRKPMADAVLDDKQRPGVDAAACSYYSLRRVVRALVDNRICGGRLNYMPRSTARDTRTLMSEYLGASLAMMLADDGPPTQVVDQSDAPPAQGTDLRVGTQAARLLPVLRRFFPDDAPTSDGSVPNLIQGDVMYGLWQSTARAYIANATKASYPIDYIGRGAPGALAYVGLAELVYNPDGPMANESPSHYSKRVVNHLATGLVKGAPMQAWKFTSTFEAIRTLDTQHDIFRYPTPLSVGFGHSPIFDGYDRPQRPHAQISIIDQNTPGGDSQYTCLDNGIDEFSINFYRESCEMWFGCNWIE